MPGTTVRWVRLALALALLLVGIFTPVCPRRAALAQDAANLDISAKHYIVVDADTGEVFAQHNADDRVAMASLTKIFTAIEAIELAPANDQITTSSADMVSSEATQMGFGPDETFPLQDLIYGMLLPSGNDAARAVARSLGAEPGDTDPAQSTQHFVDKVNQRIADMGLTETHLVNPDGWGVPDHYSSAHDLATFMMYALKYPRFVRPISTMTYDTAGGYHLVNTNKLMDEDIPGLIGGKTGFDDDAGYCLIEVAKRDGNTMISVTLDGVAPDIWYEDNVELLDYAFSQKAARVASGSPITSERLAYRDPDAAVIMRNAAAGSSVGAPIVISGAQKPAAAPAAEQPPAAPPVYAPPITGDPAAAVPRWPIPIGIAFLLIATRAIAVHGG
ncbi:MAG TPA: D-alanyl-D-alanine carboxypeptidase, partial [Thermomicrobiales bacterium]|nr:D-alanyl-D-alanine carboxypeptidase [Thermomicrobiales bacterium]